MSSSTPNESWPTPEQHPTQPILPPASTSEPPPSGLQLDEPPQQWDAATEPDWQQRFEQQRQRTRIFMATTAGAIAALLAGLVFTMASAQQTPQTGPGGMTGPDREYGSGAGPMGGMGHHDDSGRWGHHDFDDDSAFDSDSAPQLPGDMSGGGVTPPDGSSGQLPDDGNTEADPDDTTT